MRAALILCAVPFLAACDLMERIEGKNPGKDYIERLSALEAGMARITPITPPQPFNVAVITTQASTPVAVTAPEPEVCIPVFRVIVCP